MKLRSRDDALLLQARYRLEEAFLTASLPGLPPNAQLLVRRLDLGSIRADQSPALLASRISELMRNLAVAAVCVDQQPAANANVVWFSDPLQPYKVLLLRLLDGKGLHEWYWRTLFPDQTLALNSATIEMVLWHAARTPLKGLAQARLLQQALEPRRLVQLFSCITVESVRCMLHEQGLSPVAVVKVLPPAGGGVERSVQMIAAPRNMTLPWRNALQQAAQCWGEYDVRTLWFAWCALIAHQPAWLERKDVLQRIAPGDWLRNWPVNRASTAASDKGAAGFETEAACLPQAESVSPAAQTTTAIDLPALPLAQQESSSSVTASPQIDLSTAGGEAVETFLSAEAQQQKSAATPADVVSSAESVVAPFSTHAGFAFVIPLLQRLGMAELLARNERLVALDLPRQLLWSLAQRFEMDEGDPQWQLFAGFEPCGDLVIEQFRAPEVWQRLTTVRGLNPCCGSGIPAAMGAGAPFNRGRNAAPTGTAPVGEAAIQLHELINTMQLLGALYLRRHGGLAWRALIQRPGRVVLTATHWDVIFDLNHIDLRLRRIALDSDPGWVAWLGRVVQFHYDSAGGRYV